MQRKKYKVEIETWKVEIEKWKHCFVFLLFLIFPSQFPSLIILILYFVVDKKGCLSYWYWYKSKDTENLETQSKNQIKVGNCLNLRRKVFHRLNLS